MRIWIVVADEREALFYDAKGPHGPFDLALYIANRTTEPDRELESDRPGRSTVPPGGGPSHALDGDRGAQRTAQVRFAKQIAGEIERARANRRFERFVIMSAPRMLGLIRGALTAPSRTTLAGEVAKNFAQQGEQALGWRLPQARSNTTSLMR